MKTNPGYDKPENTTHEEPHYFDWHTLLHCLCKSILLGLVKANIHGTSILCTAKDFWACQKVLTIAKHPFHIFLLLQESNHTPISHFTPLASIKEELENEGYMLTSVSSYQAVKKDNCQFFLEDMKNLTPVRLSMH